MDLRQVFDDFFLPLTANGRKSSDSWKIKWSNARQCPFLVVGLANMISLNRLERCMTISTLEAVCISWGWMGEGKLILLDPSCIWNWKYMEILFPSVPNLLAPGTASIWGKAWPGSLQGQTPNTDKKTQEHWMTTARFTQTVSVSTAKTWFTVVWALASVAVPVLQAPEATEKVKEKGLGVGAIRGYQLTMRKMPAEIWRWINSDIGRFSCHVSLQALPCSLAQYEYT